MNLTIADNMLPVRLTAGKGAVSDAEFEAFCAANPLQRAERDSWGSIVLEPPVGYHGGHLELAAGAMLYNWTRASGLGIAFASQTGFTLPNGAIRAPDASWLSDERISGLPEEEKKRFVRTCPDFIIEIRSESDRLKPLQAKMREYLANGCRLAFLIDPPKGRAWVYRPDVEPELYPELTGVLSGEEVLPGFELDLALFTPKLIRK